MSEIRTALEIQQSLNEALEGRHTSTQSVCLHFQYDPEFHLASIVLEICASAALAILLTTQDGPELTVGLRKLLEAQDAFLRAAGVAW